MAALTLPHYSIGVGDRFAHQATAQLQACRLAAEAGVEVAPVWNKSNREHIIVGSEPTQTRLAADAAVRKMQWTQPYFVDADHINLKTVDRFLAPCDFFTIDVADAIGRPASAETIESFVSQHPELTGRLEIPGIDRAFETDASFVTRTASKFLAAVQEAGVVYRHVTEQKGTGSFVPEISLDETDAPQTPPELLVILAAIAAEGIPIQTIAPKFTGRFNKGVDYVGNLHQFTQEFSDDVAVIAFAVKQYALPSNLKLSVHSGSDKFSIYSPIRQILARTGAGVHLKTAGTTWLEELIGLAESGESGLRGAKQIYAQAHEHQQELSAPYASVIDIDPTRLPSPSEVANWSSEQYTTALRHEPQNPGYNSSFRQLLHVGFKVAAKMGPRYLELLTAHESNIAKNVTVNLYARHIGPLFVGR